VAEAIVSMIELLTSRMVKGAGGGKRALYKSKALRAAKTPAAKGAMLRT
jgi:hypothetical protein